MVGVVVCVQHCGVVGNWSHVSLWVLNVKEGVTVMWGYSPLRGDYSGVCWSPAAGEMSSWGRALTISEILTFSPLAGLEESAGPPGDHREGGSHSRLPAGTIEVVVLSRLG